MRPPARSKAMRLALEKLSPSERAAYVLRHAFDYPYVRIAQIIQQSPASVRQHVSRARRRLTGGDCAPISAIKHQQLVDAFVAGARDGNLIPLERLFAADVIQGGNRCRPARGRTGKRALKSSRTKLLTFTPAHTGRAA